MTPYSRAIGAPVMRSATYAAISTVAAMEMRLASLLARSFLSRRQSGHSSPQPSPQTRRPHRTQGTSGCPSRNRMAELLRAGDPPEVTGADPVAHDGRDDGIPDPLGSVQLSDMIQHHGSGKHLCRGIGEALTGNVRSAAMHRLKNGGLGSDVGARGEPQPAHQTGHLVTQDVTEHIRGHHDVELLRAEHQLHRGVV